MILNIIILLLSLGIILFGCELFTNGVEWLGKKLNMGDGVVGSIFSAVGTCLPETLIPVIALLFSKNQANSVEIGIGAIAGAPFMLSTLAFFITGLSVIVFSKKRKSRYGINVNFDILSRDISFFVLVYTSAIMVSFASSHILKFLVAILLITFYILYIIKTVNNDTMGSEQIDDLIFSSVFKTRTSKSAILIQIALALGAIIAGAELFVQNIEIVSKALNVSTLALSIIITPIATELPEKFNSIIWISKNKDTLSLGNITGAMVFQSCIPVSIGILATDWKLDTITLISAFLALASSLVTYIWMKTQKKLNPVPLLMGGLFYITFIFYLIINGFK